MGALLASVVSTKFLGAIFSTIFIIMMGYFLRKKDLVSEHGPKVLSAILLSVALPALAFKAFMKDITEETYTTGINILIFGFIAYILLIILGHLFYAKYQGDKKDLMIVLTAFGSTTFFGIPIINGLLGDTGTLYANVFNIAYRVFLYSYALIVMSSAKFEVAYLKKIFLNPIIIATFIGLAIWVFQGSLPQADVMVKGELQHYAVFRLDKTLPWVHKGIVYLGSLSSPLAWLAIGMTLAQISLGEALQEKKTVIYAFIKQLIIPAVFLGILILANSVGINFQYEAVVAIIIMLATPPATVAVAYAISYEKEALLASNISLVATVTAVFAIIFWIVATTMLHGINII